jgi:hypothetical protein
VAHPTPLTYAAYSPVRPIAGFDRLLVFQSTGESIYHGLALQLNKSFSRNFALLGSYTLSKVIDNNPNV